MKERYRKRELERDLERERKIRRVCRGEMADGSTKRERRRERDIVGGRERKINRKDGRVKER